MVIRAIQALSGWKRQAVATAAGAMTALALPPVNFLPVCFLTFPVLVWLLDGVYDRRAAGWRPGCRLAALTGWSFGFGYFVAGLWWLGSAMLIDIRAYGWTIPFAVFGLPAFLAVFYGFATLAAFTLWQGGFGRIAALGFAFGLAEWLRGWMFTGFPWNAIGYTAMPVPLLMQPAALLGLYGMNALAVLVYATPALLSDRGGRKAGFVIAGLLVAADIGFGFYRLGGLPAAGAQQAASIRVRIIQPSIPQSEKIDSATQLANFERHLHLTTAAPRHGDPLPRLIVWPETALPFVLEYSAGTLARIGHALQPGQLAVIGTIRMQPQTDPAGRPRYFNTMQIVDHTGKIIASADKAHLVPFGEYLPLAGLFNRFGLKAIAEVAGAYSAAARHTTIALENGPVILPLICYEAIFPTELGHDGPSPDVLVNITNDAWFGHTPGPWQHFAQARLRAVEQGKPLIRAANNGISAMIDPYGRIISIIHHNEIGFTDIDLPEKNVSIWNKNGSILQAFYVFAVLFLCAVRLRLYP